MARKKQVQTRIPVDTKARLDEYQEDKELSQADAVRRLINVGLAEEGYAVTKSDGGGSWLERRAVRIARIGELSGAATTISAIYGLLAYTLFNQPTFALSAFLVAVASLATSVLCIVLLVVIQLAIRTEDQDAEDSILGRVV